MHQQQAMIRKAGMASDPDFKREAHSICSWQAKSLLARLEQHKERSVVLIPRDFCLTSL